MMKVVRTNRRWRTSAGRSPHRPIADINVVPYIDVLFALLIIFIISAPALYSGVDVKLPAAGSATLTSTSLPIIVTIDIDGHYYLDTHRGPERRVDHDELRARVAPILKRHPGTSVIIKADAGAAFHSVIAAMALMKDAGAVEIGLMTRRR